MFLDDTACNLASINLGAFLDDASGAFDIDGYLHAIRLWTIVLEISVTMAHFPSHAIARGSYDFRTLGLGYANLGSLLMRSGIPYDSDEGRAIAGALTAILTGESYATSADMATVRGPFPGFEKNRENMLRVMRNHRRAAYNESGFEGVSNQVSTIDPEHCPTDLLHAARRSWDRALEMGERHGYRKRPGDRTGADRMLGGRLPHPHRARTGPAPVARRSRRRPMAGARRLGRNRRRTPDRDPLLCERGGARGDRRDGARVLHPGNTHPPHQGCRSPDRGLGLETLR